MYEQTTYETILNAMLSRVRAAGPELDIREGSLIYNALAPAAIELQLMYIELETILRETFADTQSRPYLVRRAAERGITAKDDETAEQLRRRYMQSLSALAFGGNAADYIQKASSLPGVGGVKVTPVWEGGGTVLLTIASSNYGSPPPEIIASVQETIDPVPGQGLGLAPIGHAVTVRGAEIFGIHISAKFDFHPGYGFEMVKLQLEQAAESYFAERRAVWADEEPLIIRISGLEQRFLAVPGVLDVTGTNLNGKPGNLTPGAYGLPVLEGITHAE